MSADPKAAPAKPAKPAKAAKAAKPAKAAPAAKRATPAAPGQAAKVAAKGRGLPAGKSQRAAQPLKADRPSRTGKGPGAPQALPSSLDPHAHLLHPIVTEKTMALMDANNSLEFLVRRTSTRREVKAAVEKLFDCQVDHVNTRITKDGKRAVVKFGGETSAEDIGMRIGVF